MTYFLKKHLSIYKSNNKINIISPIKDVFLLFDIKNEPLLNKLIQKGITQKELETNKFYIDLYENQLIYKQTFFNERKINRNLLFFDYCNIDVKKFKNIKKTKILIYGIGGLGSSLTYMLAQLGFTNLIVVDFDIVEKSDIEKILIYNKDHINKKKTKALKDIIFKDFSFEIKIIEEKYANIEQISNVISENMPDLVINACDPLPTFKIDLNKVCFENKIPYLSIHYSFEYILLGPLYVPTITSCENSFNKKLKELFKESYSSSSKMYKDYLVHPSNLMTINMASSMAIKEIIFFVLEKYDYCYSIGRKIIFNTLNFETNYYNAECKNCSVCNH